MGWSGARGSRTSAASFLEHQNAFRQSGVHEQLNCAFHLSYCVHVLTMCSFSVVVKKEESNAKRETVFVHSATERSLRHATTDVDDQRSQET